MSTGQVKWFNNTKGYGFILPDGEDDDLFAHYSEVAMEGYKTLKAGQRVSFESADGPKGRHATNIQPLDTPPSADKPAEAAESEAAAEADAPAEAAEANEASGGEGDGGSDGGGDGDGESAEANSAD